MKGLILKDLYQTAKYCRLYLVMMVVMCIIYPFGRGYLFALYYPCVLCVVIPVNMLSYDERSGWEVFAQALPCTKAQIVTGKYVLGLLLQLVPLTLSAVSMVVAWGPGNWGQIGPLLALLVATPLLSTALLLPCAFAFGTEKGRIVLTVVMVGLFALLGGASVVSSQDTSILSQLPGSVLAAVCAAAVVAYVLSWRLSITVYNRREVGK